MSKEFGNIISSKNLDRIATNNQLAITNKHNNYLTLIPSIN